MNKKQIFVDFFFCKLNSALCCSLGPNGQVTYGGIFEEDFNINPITGVITTTKALDRELREYYTVTGKVLKHYKLSALKMAKYDLFFLFVLHSSCQGWRTPP